MQSKSRYQKIVFMLQLGNLILLFDVKGTNKKNVGNFFKTNLLNKF